MDQQPQAPRRAIRSFVRREGRLTPGQRHALDSLWERYGVDNSDDLLDLDAVFGRGAPRILEIGFGNGEVLVTLAERYPENDYLGVEVYRPGVGRLLSRASERGLSNVKVIIEDAVVVLARCIPDASLDKLLIFFPDPWPKKRHHKRRLIQSAFVGLLRTKLKRGGRLHLATDWEDYAQHMLAVLSETAGLRNLAGPGQFSPRPAYRPLTKFEARGQRLGHPVWDLLFQKFVREPPV